MVIVQQPRDHGLQPRLPTGIFSTNKSNLHHQNLSGLEVKTEFQLAMFINVLPSYAQDGWQYDSVLWHCVKNWTGIIVVNSKLTYCKIIHCQLLHTFTHLTVHKTIVKPPSFWRFAVTAECPWLLLLMMYHPSISLFCHNRPLTLTFMRMCITIELCIRQQICAQFVLALLPLTNAAW